MKKTERTDQTQSLELSKLLGNTDNASISIIEKGKEVYKSYSTRDLIDILSKSKECHTIYLQPWSGMWIVKYAYIHANSMLFQEVHRKSLVKAMLYIIKSRIKETSLC